MDETHVNGESTESNTNNGIKSRNSVLDNFNKLTKNKEKLRIKGGVCLVKYLLEEGEEESELKHALGRIIRGLGSSKVESRSGFYSTFVALLNLSDITLEQIFEHVDKELHRVKGNSKSENADASMGQILVCSAVIRSELFSKCSKEEQTKVLQCLINAGKERSYLLYPSYQILLELTEKLSSAEFSSLVLPIIQSDLQKPLPEHNLDSLYLLIQLKLQFPKIIEKQVLKKAFGTTQLINENNCQDLANILLNIPRITVLHHPVYEAFSKLIVGTTFTPQFIKHVDEILTRYNRNKHLVTVNVLTLILNNSENPNEVPELLTENLIQQTLTIFRQLKGAEHEYEIKSLTHELFNAILETLKREAKEKTKISVLKKLIFFPGTLNFEKITQSKLVQQITGVLKSDGVKKLAKLYRQIVLLENEKFNAEKNEAFINNDRLYVANLLAKLLSHPAVHDENDWKCEQLKFLMSLGLFRQENIGVELAASLKDTFYRSLDVKLSKLDDLSNVLLQVFNELDSHLSEDNLESALRSPVSPDVYATWTKARDLINKIEGKKSKKVKLVFQILFLHLGLQLFTDVKLAKDSLEELFSCYERTKKQKKAEGTDDPEWIEVVVELFLSLLSHNSHLLRKVINCVFPHLCKYLNGTSIHQILSVLDPKNENNPLVHKNHASDDESEESDDENEKSDESDNDEDDDDDEEEAQEDSDEDENSEDDDLEETNNDKLRRALHVALMQNAENDDQSDVDLDELDEEHGEKLNKALAEVFKQYKPNLGKSKKQNKDDEALTHFRVRVLDLIEIYLDSNPSMILTLEIMLPLLQTLEFSIKNEHQKPLQGRLKSCLKKLTNLKKFDDMSNVDSNVLRDLLESLLQKGNKSAVLMQFMGEVLAQCCAFIIKCSQSLLNVEESKTLFNQDIVDILINSMNLYLKKRECHIPLILFKHILQMTWTGNIEIVKNISVLVFEEDVKSFRKCNGLQLLGIFYSNHRLLTTVDDETKSLIREVTYEFLQRCTNIFSSMVQNPKDKDIKEKFVSFLFTQLKTIKHCPVQCPDFDWQGFGEVVRECRGSFNISQDTRKAFNKLCSALGISNKVQGNLGQTMGNSNSVTTTNVKEKKKNKQNKNNDALKLKKEAKEKRLKSLSEGLECGFSQYVNGIENGVNMENVDRKKSKKRRLSETDVKKTKKNKT